MLVAVSLAATPAAAFDLDALRSPARGTHASGARSRGRARGLRGAAGFRRLARARGEPRGERPRAAHGAATSVSPSGSTPTTCSRSTSSCRPGPVASIRDLGSLLRPVWKREAGRIGGRAYTLDRDRARHPAQGGRAAHPRGDRLRLGVVSFARARALPRVHARCAARGRPARLPRGSAQGRASRPRARGAHAVADLRLVRRGLRARRRRARRSYAHRCRSPRARGC